MFEDLKSKPHSLRSTLKKAGLNIADVAKFLGLSFGRTQTILAGRDTAPSHIENRLQELARLCTDEPRAE